MGSDSLTKRTYLLIGRCQEVGGFCGNSQGFMILAEKLRLMANRYDTGRRESELGRENSKERINNLKRDDRIFYFYFATPTPTPAPTPAAGAAAAVDGGVNLET